MEIDRVEVKSSRIRGRNKAVKEVTEVEVDDFSQEYVQLSGSISNRQADEKDLGDFFDGSNEMAIDVINENPEHHNR
jgi:hypothetical protein